MVNMVNIQHSTFNLDAPWELNVECSGSKIKPPMDPLAPPVV
jgi:hypothetical protein